MNKQENKNEEEFEPYHDEGVIELNPKIEMRGHRWVQRGFSIFCESCPLRHSSYVGNRVRLIGIEDGLPIFKKI